MSGPKFPIPPGSKPLSSKSVKEWVKILAADIRPRCREHTGDATAGVSIGIETFLSILNKWKDGIGVELHLDRGLVYFLAFDPDPNVMSVVRVFQVEIPDDIKMGISDHKIRDLRKKFFLSHIPDKDFFARGDEPIM